ncbi:hypothetical protein FRC11_011589 [Ceratobasidium sp. 423]|nr:hypothetical protein FRC11_011589 [Ceratobasidium sp. 423]
MLASSSLHHFSTREPSHIAHEHHNSNSSPSPNLNLALCSARPSTDAVPRPFFELAPSRYQPAPASSAPTRALSGLPDLRAPPGGAKLPLDPPEDAPVARRGSIVRSYSQSYPQQHSQHPAHHHSEQFVPAHSPASAPVSTLNALREDHDDPDGSQEQLAGAYLPPQQAPPASVPETMTNHHLQYPTSYEQEYMSRAPSVSPAYNTDDRRVSVSSAGSYEHAYPYGSYAQPRPFQPGPARATPPMMARPSSQLTPYDYPVESSWAGRRPSTEQSPVPQQRGFDDYHPEDSVVSTMMPQQGLGYPQLGHQSPMQSLGSSSSNSTGVPASPDQLAMQPNGLVAALPEGATPPSATNPGQRTYAFVSLAGSTIRKRPRRRYDEIERLYSCSFEDCTKAYGTLNHLNAHVTMQKHGAKRNPSGKLLYDSAYNPADLGAEFKELRKLWRTQKKAEQVANRPRGKRRDMDDDHPHALHRTSSGSFSSPGAYGSEDSDDGGTPQPGDSHHYQHGQVDQMWSQMGSEMGGRYDSHPGMQGYGHGHDPHGHGMGVVMPAEEGPMDRIPPDATLLQSLPPTHPSQQHQFSNSMHHSMASYGGMPAMSGNPGPLMRRASDHSYDYPPPRPSGPSGQSGAHGPGPHGYGRDGGNSRLALDKRKHGDHGYNRDIDYPVELDVRHQVVHLAAGGWSFHALTAEGKVVGRRHAVLFDGSRNVYILLEWGRPIRLNTPALDGKRPESTVVQVEAGWDVCAFLTETGTAFVVFPFHGSFESEREERRTQTGTPPEVKRQGDEVPCVCTDLQHHPTRLPPIPGDLPTLHENPLKPDASPKLIQIAAGDKFVVGLTDGGHVLKLDLPTYDESEIGRMITRGDLRWNYLPKFCDVTHVRNEPGFRPQGQQTPALEDLKVTHISAQFRTFVVYSTVGSSVVLLGDIHHNNSQSPNIIPELQNRGVISVVLGDYHYCALTSNGELFSWGKYSNGALGLGSPSNPHGHMLRLQAMAPPLMPPHISRPPRQDAEVPTQVHFHHEDNVRDRYVFAVAASGWHCGALVIDLHSTSSTSTEGKPNPAREGEVPVKQDRDNPSHTSMEYNAHNNEASRQSPIAPFPTRAEAERAAGTQVPQITIPIVRGRGAPFRIGYAARGAYAGRGAGSGFAGASNSGSGAHLGREQ